MTLSEVNNASKRKEITQEPKENDLEESKEAETILKTHKITDESQLEEIVAEIKIKTKQIQKIPITVNSGQLVEAATLDSHAKTLYESIASLEKSTEFVEIPMSNTSMPPSTYRAGTPCFANSKWSER